MTSHWVAPDHERREEEGASSDVPPLPSLDASAQTVPPRGPFKDVTRDRKTAGLLARLWVSQCHALFSFPPLLPLSPPVLLL